MTPPTTRMSPPMNDLSVPARPDPPPGADGLVVVLSDIEMGGGGPLDDFPHDAWLAELIAARVAGLPDDFRIDLVFNGDTWDFLKTSVRGTFPAHIDAGVALGKLERISAAHPRFFEVLRGFLAGGAPGRRRVSFIVGNHDPEILFPEVQAAIHALLGSAPGVSFPGASLRIGDIHLEHGQQSDSMFAMDFERPFLSESGRDILNLPWGSVTLLSAAMPLQPLVFQYDRVKPREQLLALLPELKELLLDAFFRYWTGDYLKSLLAGSDPLTRLSWVLFKEVIYRFGTHNPDVTVSDHWTAALQRSGDLRLVVLGHEHRAAWWSYGDRKILRAGCLRDEHMISSDGRRTTPLPKVWVEAWTRGESALCSALIEAFGPPSPPGHMPDDLHDGLAAIRAELGPSEERASRLSARAEREAHEHHGGAAPPKEEARRGDRTGGRG